MNPALNARVFTEAGGEALGAGAGYPGLAWLGAGLGVIALGVVAVSVRRSKVPTP